MSNASHPDIVEKAADSYQRHQRHWTFLGYSEEVAIAVLVKFFSMRRVRNPSQKPLNVLSMVGKRRVKAIAEAIKAQHRPSEDEPGDMAP